MFICDLRSQTCQSQSGLTKHRESGKCRTNRARNIRGVPVVPLPAAVNENSFKDRLLSARKVHTILSHVPVAARKACAERLTTIFRACCQKNFTFVERHAVICIMLISASYLHAPSSKGGKGPSPATSVKANLRGVTQQTSRRKKLPEENHIDIRKIVTRKLQDGDINGAVRVLSSEDCDIAIDD